MAHRPSLKEGIEAALPAMKKTMTKDFTDGPSPEEIKALSKIYDEKCKDWAALAGHFKLDAELLEAAKPASVEDFAKGMFAGNYTKDMDEAGKKALRTEISQKLLERKDSLRHVEGVTTGTRGSLTTDPDVKILHTAAMMWDELKGDLAQIAQRCEIDLDLLKGNQPADASEFSKKLLDGFYTAEKTEAAKQQLRETMKKEIKRTQSQLRKSITKDYEGPSPELIASIAKFFPGEVDKVVETHGLSADLVKQHPAKDAEDFAKKVLGGTYTPATA